MGTDKHMTEIWLAADVNEPPIAWPLQRGSEPPDRIEVEITGPTATLRIEVDITEARNWAAELFACVSAAYREATGDPHALSEDEVASLNAAGTGYIAGPGFGLRADDNGPARLRFNIVVEIAGQSLNSSLLRETLVERITGDFNVAHVAVSGGEPQSGSIDAPCAPASHPQPPLGSQLPITL
jgi:hypothetical protein